MTSNSEKLLIKLISDRIGSQITTTEDGDYKMDIIQISDDAIKVVLGILEKHKASIVNAIVSRYGLVPTGEPISLTVKEYGNLMQAVGEFTNHGEWNAINKHWKAAAIIGDLDTISSVGLDSGW